jgi:hypothetical protein
MARSQILGSSHSRRQKQSSGRSCSFAWSLIILLQSDRLQDSQCFVAHRNLHRNTKTVMSMDPYEQQYQQYFNNGGSTNVNVNVNLNDYQQQQSDGYPYEQQSFQDQTVTNTDSYESQVQQYCQSSPGLPGSSSEPGVWETIESSIHSEAALADSWSSDPYEMQYQQYFQSPKIAPQTAWDQPTAYQLPMNPPMDTSQTPTTEMTMNAPTAGMHLEQQQEEEEDRGDEFLRMVSNEVQYKKLIGQNPYALTDIQVSVLVQRFLDNLEDATQKNNGKVKGQSRLKGVKMPKEQRKTVLVLGSGWAAHAFIKLASTYDLRIVVVSPANHFVSLSGLSA